MAVIGYDPVSVFARLQNDINRLFDSHFQAGESSAATADWVPAVDIDEFQDRFELHVDMPGVEPGEIELTLEKGVLTISGNRSVPESEAAVRHRRRERVRGHFYRRFTLPDTVNAEGVRASGSNGVLDIVIPKQVKPQSRRISVEG